MVLQFIIKTFHCLNPHILSIYRNSFNFIYHTYSYECHNSFHISYFSYAKHLLTFVSFRRDLYVLALIVNHVVTVYLF